MNGLWTVYEQQHLLQYVRWWRRHKGCIHGNLPKCEWLTNNLWTIYEQIMNKSPLDRSFNFNLRLSPKSFCPPALRYLCLFPLPQAVFLSGLSAKPRLCWIMNNAWAVHEQCWIGFLGQYLARILRKVVLDSLCQDLSPRLKKTPPAFAEKDSWTSGTS